MPTTLRTAENHDRRNTSLTEQADGASATRSREFPRLNVTYCPLSQHWLLRPASRFYTNIGWSRYVWIVNKCAQLFFADKFFHATSVPVAVHAAEGKVRVLGRERVRGFGVVAWGIGTKSS